MCRLLTFDTICLKQEACLVVALWASFKLDVSIIQVRSIPREALKMSDKTSYKIHSKIKQRIWINFKKYIILKLLSQALLQDAPWSWDSNMLRKDHSGIASFPVIPRVQNSSNMWLKFTRQEKFPHGLRKVRQRSVHTWLKNRDFHEHTKLVNLMDFVHENKNQNSNNMLSRMKIELGTHGVLLWCSPFWANLTCAS